MKRTLSIRLQNSDVFYAPKSLGLKAHQQNSIMCGDMELNGLHPLSCHFAQNTIVEIVAFTDWVQKVLKINGALPRRGSWSASIRDLERKLSE
jgi:purine-nucleoside phosphorylase